MVEASNAQEDGAENYSVQYAAFRTDKAVTPGHTAELINNRIDRAYYDDLVNTPFLGCEREPTLIKYFKRNV